MKTSACLPARVKLGEGLKKKMHVPPVYACIIAVEAFCSFVFAFQT